MVAIKKLLSNINSVHENPDNFMDFEQTADNNPLNMSASGRDLL